MEKDGVTRIFGHRFVSGEDGVQHFTGLAEDYPAFQEESVDPEEKFSIQKRADVTLVDAFRPGDDTIEFTIYPKGELEDDFSRKDFDEFTVRRTPKDQEANNRAFNSKIVDEVEAQVGKKGLTILR